MYADMTVSCVATNEELDDFISHNNQLSEEALTPIVII